MRKLALLAILALLFQVTPYFGGEEVQSLTGKWTQANGGGSPIFDEFMRADDTGNTVVATTPLGQPYVVWEETKSIHRQICVTTFDGVNWVAPSGSMAYGGIDILTTYGNCTDPSIAIMTYDDGASILYIPIIFFKKNGGYSEIVCAYLSGNAWVFGTFNTYQMLDEPFVTVATDGTVCATWSVLDGNNNYQPIFIKAEPDFPLKWKYANGSTVFNPPMPIFTSTASHQQCRVDLFDGTPYLATSRRVSGNDADIGIYKFDGSGWIGLDSPSPTILGDPSHDDKGPRIVMNSSGSPVITWFVDRTSNQKGMFAFWNGSDWVSPGKPDPTDLSAEFCGGKKSFEPDLARGVGGMFHIAFNFQDGGNVPLSYAQTDLNGWFMANGDPGNNILDFGLTAPSLAVTSLNNPMIAGDRLLPDDNPVFTQWTTDAGIIVDWGIETKPVILPGMEHKNYYDDNGRVVLAQPQELKLRCIVAIPKKDPFGNILFDYNIPNRCAFNPNVGLCDMPSFFKIKGQQGWYPFIPDPFFEWRNVSAVRFIKPYTKLASVRFGISFNGFNQAGTWLISNADVTITESLVGPPPIIPQMPSELPNLPNMMYQATHTVSNPVQSPAPPSFYLDADRYNGQVSTDGSLEAVFTIFIFPLGPFFEEVDLSLAFPTSSYLTYTFTPTTVPRGYGVRKSILRVRATERTPSGYHNLVVTGKSTVLGYPPGTTIDVSDTLELSVYTLAPKLVLHKRADRVSVSPGSFINYTITVKNIGGAAATNVVLEDQLPQDVNYISSNPNGSGSGKKVTWDIGAINPNQSLVFTLKVQVKQEQFGSGASISNVAVAFYNGWLTSSATVYVMVRPTETPCPNPQAELKFATDGDEPVAGKPIDGTLYVWDGCNPYSFQLFWGDDSREVRGNLDKEGSYKLPPHTYSQAGTYMIACHVTDKYGKQNVLRKHIVVH